jgi:gamma-glutamylaminecyclotransferase
MGALLFVYGTLKRGCRNHRHLGGQTFVGPARTVPGFTLYDLGGYPGIAADPAAVGVTGEIWTVDAAALARLDAFEGVHEGLYRRAPIALQTPSGETAAATADAYFPTVDLAGRPHVGAEWRE